MPQERPMNDPMDGSGRAIGTYESHPQLSTRFCSTFVSRSDSLARILPTRSGQCRVCPVFGSSWGSIDMRWPDAGGASLELGAIGPDFGQLRSGVTTSVSGGGQPGAAALPVPRGRRCRSVLRWQRPPTRPFPRCVGGRGKGPGRGLRWPRHVLGRAESVAFSCVGAADGPMAAAGAAWRATTETCGGGRADRCRMSGPPSQVVRPDVGNKQRIGDTWSASPRPSMLRRSASRLKAAP